jgi:hypothetical protein
MAKWHNLAINKHWWAMGATSITSLEEGHERIWRTDMTPWSENNVEAFQGLHNRGRRVLVVFDEASSIADAVWDAAEAAQTDEGTETIWLSAIPPQGRPVLRSGFRLPLSPLENFLYRLPECARH